MNSLCGCLHGFSQQKGGQIVDETPEMGGGAYVARGMVVRVRGRG